MKTWSKPETMLLAQMMRSGHFNKQRMAERFACSLEDLELKMIELTAPKDEAPRPSSSPTPTPEDPDMLLDPVQREFVSLCKHYNDMGDRLKTFAAMVSFNHAEEDLEKVLIDIYETPRQSTLTIHQHVAHQLADRFIIIPKPAEVNRIEALNTHEQIQTGDSGGDREEGQRPQNRVGEGSS